MPKDFAKRFCQILDKTLKNYKTGIYFDSRIDDLQDMINDCFRKNLNFRFCVGIDSSSNLKRAAKSNRCEIIFNIDEIILDLYRITIRKCR